MVLRYFFLLHNPFCSVTRNRRQSRYGIYISDYSGFSVGKLALLPQKQLQQPEKLFFTPASVSDRNGAAVRQAPARTQHPGDPVINSLFRFTFAADPEAAAFQAAFNAFQLPVVKQHILSVCPPADLRIDKPSGDPAGISVSVQIKSKAFIFVRRLWHQLRLISHAPSGILCGSALTAGMCFPLPLRPVLRHPEKCWRSTEKKVPVTAETGIMSAITVSALAA